MPWCGYMEHGLEYIMFYVKKYIEHCSRRAARDACICENRLLFWLAKPVTTLLGVILLWSWSNLIGTYLGSRSRTEIWVGFVHGRHGPLKWVFNKLIIPRLNEAGYTGFTLSVCPSAWSVGRIVSFAILAVSISYLHILSSNFKRCVQILNSKIWNFGKFFKFVTLSLSSFDLGSNNTCTNQ